MSIIVDYKEKEIRSNYTVITRINDPHECP